MKTAKIPVRPTIYRYSIETCRYERVKPTLTNFLFYSTGLIITSTFILATLLLLHDLLVESEKEKLYRKENIAIQKNEVILANQLEAVENTLSILKQKDKDLHKKFFASVISLQDESVVSKSKQNILLADALQLNQFVIEIQGQTDKLIAVSSGTHNIVANNQIENRMGTLPALPTMIPIEGVKSTSLLSGYGMRINPFHKGLYHHDGVDISVPRGTAVRSSAAGEIMAVSYSLLLAGYGNYIEIDHGNGFISRYAHLEAIKVRKGEKVQKGFIIATSGNSGGSIAPHLHYEILQHGKNVDPVRYLIQGFTAEEYEQFIKAGQKENQSLD